MHKYKKNGRIVRLSYRKLSKFYQSAITKRHVSPLCSDTIFSYLVKTEC